MIPAYNEEKSIISAINEVKRYAPQYSKILIINDGSIDDTKKNAKKTGIKIISHKKNRGYGAALKTGFKHANAKYIAFLDADLTYHPKYVKKFLKILEKEDGLDIVWGSRLYNLKNRMPLIRRMGNIFLSVILSIITQRIVKDSTCGERVFRKRLLKKIKINDLSDGLDFITGFSKKIVSNGIKFAEVPIVYRERAGKSKLKLRYGFKFLKEILLK